MKVGIIVVLAAAIWMFISLLVISLCLAAKAGDKALGMGDEELERAHSPGVGTRRHLTPWREARGALPATAWSTAEITPESLLEFYEALDADENVGPVDELDCSEFEA